MFSFSTLVKPVISRASHIVLFTGILLYSPISTATEHHNVWSFTNTIHSAQKNDPWLTGNKHQQQTIEALSHAAASLPDPKMSVALANLPTNSFDFSQEGMTQLNIGISQMFPRGDSLTIKNQQLRIQSEAYPFQRANREAQVAVIVGSLWLDAYRVQQSITLIETNRALFEQLVDVAQTSYSATSGKTRQQDIIRAQLELTQLDDRLDNLAQQKSTYLGQLSQWLSMAFLNRSSQQSSNAHNQLSAIKVTAQLPTLTLIHQGLAEQHLANTSNAANWLSVDELARHFAQHPSVIALDKKILATKTGINLAEQAYKPEWGVSASYGYRDDDPMGRSRADFFSVGVTFDLPLFTDNRQDMTVKSAVSATEAVKTEKILLLRQLLGAFSSAQGRLTRLQSRKALYQTRLLPQIHDQAAALLTAYHHDDGDFSAVVRARIAVLNAEVEQLNIMVEEQKIILELNYLFVGSLATDNSANSLNYSSINNMQQALAQREEK